MYVVCYAVPGWLSFSANPNPNPRLNSTLAPQFNTPTHQPTLAGKAGAGLKAIMEESGAKIRVGHEEELPPGSNERCVRPWVRAWVVRACPCPTCLPACLPACLLA